LLESQRLAVERRRVGKEGYVVLLLPALPYKGVELLQQQRVEVLAIKCSRVLG
jgi:hypothetical protein